MGRTEGQPTPVSSRWAPPVPYDVNLPTTHVTGHPVSGLRTATTGHPRGRSPSPRTPPTTLLSHNYFRGSREAPPGMGLPRRTTNGEGVVHDTVGGQDRLQR